MSESSNRESRTHKGDNESNSTRGITNIESNVTAMREYWRQAIRLAGKHTGTCLSGPATQQIHAMLEGLSNEFREHLETYVEEETETDHFSCSWHSTFRQHPPWGMYGEIFTFEFGARIHIGVFRHDVTGKEVQKQISCERDGDVLDVLPDDWAVIHGNEGIAQEERTRNHFPVVIGDRDR